MENKAWLIAGVVVVVITLGVMGYQTVLTMQAESLTAQGTVPAKVGHHQDAALAKSAEDVHDAHDHNHGDHHIGNETPAYVSNSDLEYHVGDIYPIPNSPKVNKTLARIGWQLFRDPNLSSNNTISCESCHSLTGNGAELVDVSTGVMGKGSRNSLTVFNTSLNYRFFWDGRVNNLHDQLDGPVHNIMEMDSNWPAIERYVSGSAEYQPLFANANLDPTTATIKNALVEFMNGLTTPNAPFDQYLRGDNSALSESQLRGWQTFQDMGCINCHRGTNIGGGMMVRFGVFGEDKIGEERSQDTGRFLETKRPEDLYLFRVASLRNVAITPPYFHDGKTTSLQEAIQIMAQSQLGRTFDQGMLNDVEAFLVSLTGQRPTLLGEFENESN